MIQLNILIIEPFSGGSHLSWLNGIRKYSRHNIQSLELPDRDWKWRMHGGAITLAQKFLDLKFKPDLVMFSDMMDVSTFLALTKDKLDCATCLYFHENQLTYPWSPIDRDKSRKQHYEFINYASALVVDKIFFNSTYNMKSFLGSLPKFLSQFPPPNNKETISEISEKSSVLPVGVELPVLISSPANSVPVVLWNHRWEYDKNPETFFKILFRLHKEDIDFQLIILGESFELSPSCFEQAKSLLASQIIHCGYTRSKDEYWELLQQADILPVTSNQEFFGISVVEAIYAGCYPILPNRLAFPELLPAVNYGENLYSETEELYQKLRKSLIRLPQVSGTLTANVIKFKWESVIRDYDGWFERLAH